MKHPARYTRDGGGAWQRQYAIAPVYGRAQCSNEDEPCDPLGYRAAAACATPPP